MKDETHHYAYVGHLLASELIRRNQSGEVASADELEAAVLRLLAARKVGGFKQFLGESRNTPKR